MASVTDLLSKNVGGGADCRSVQAPTLSMDINGFTITLGPEDYMSNTIVPAIPPSIDSATNPASPALVGSSGAGLCRPRVMPVNFQKPLGPNVFLLGEPVLHRYYTVYDWHKQRVGFGLANSHKNRLRLRNSSSPSVSAEDLTALEGEDEEIFLMQMTVTIAVCEEATPAAPLLSTSLLA